MKDFRKFSVWGKAYGLALGIYKATSAFPVEERFGLTSQLRRAGVSIAANIAEGCGRAGDPELRRFFQIAMGSASEVECHLLLARDLCFLPQHEYEGLSEHVIEVKQMLSSLIVSIGRRLSR